MDALRHNSYSPATPEPFALREQCFDVSLASRAAAITLRRVFHKPTEGAAKLVLSGSTSHEYSTSYNPSSFLAPSNRVVA